MEKMVTFHNLISLVLNLQFRIPQDLWFLANNSTSTMRLTEKKKEDTGGIKTVGML